MSATTVPLKARTAVMADGDGVRDSFPARELGMWGLSKDAGLWSQAFRDGERAFTLYE
jgi:hypothetical protein